MFDELEFLSNDEQVFENEYRGTTQLKQLLEQLKSSVAVVEEMVAQSSVDDDLIEELGTCIAASGELAAMYCKLMDDDFISSTSFNDEAGYGFSYCTLLEPIFSQVGESDVPLGSKH